MDAPTTCGNPERPIPSPTAQDAFETVASRLADATLETYTDYADAGGNFRTNAAFVADHLARRSDLAFACGPARRACSLQVKRTTAGCAVFFRRRKASRNPTPIRDSAICSTTSATSSSSATTPPTPRSCSPRTATAGACAKSSTPPRHCRSIRASSSAAWIQQLVPPGTAVPMLAENVIALVVLPDRYTTDPGAALAPHVRLRFTRRGERSHAQPTPAAVESRARRHRRTLRRAARPAKRRKRTGAGRGEPLPAGHAVTARTRPRQARRLAHRAKNRPPHFPARDSAPVRRVVERRRRNSPA